MVAFCAARVPIDIAEFHTYAVDWTLDRAEFLVDGGLVRSCPRPPSYPMQMMLAVSTFRRESIDGDADATPSLVVDWVRAYQR
jgi:beta-glucanase (GH16 family)